MKQILFLLSLLASLTPRVAAELFDEYGVERARLPLAPFQAGKGCYLLVKPIKQIGPRCAPTSASIVLEYYGADINATRIWALEPEAFSARAKLENAGAENFETIQSALRRVNYHWSVKEFAAGASGFREGMREIKAELSSGHPVLAEVCLSENGHAFVISGYNEFAQLVFIVDPALVAPGKRVLTCEEFERVWNRRDSGLMERRAMFTLPQGERPVVPVVLTVPDMPAVESPKEITAEERDKIRKFGDFEKSDFWQHPPPFRLQQSKTDAKGK